MFTANTLFIMAQRAIYAGVTDGEVHDWLAESQAMAEAAGSEEDLAHATVGLVQLLQELLTNKIAAASRIDATGPLDGGVVVDTTNQFSRGGPVDLGGRTAARVNADRMPGAPYPKCFNTLTAGFQAAVAPRTGYERVVQWIVADDYHAAEIVSGLVNDAGYAPVLLAGIDTCAVMEAPRRPGAVYGEEYRMPDAAAVVDAVRAGWPIPPTPTYPPRT
jgi:predicted dinucleotide-binding enzyme